MLHTPHSGLRYIRFLSLLDTRAQSIIYIDISTSVDHRLDRRYNGLPCHFYSFLFPNSTFPFPLVSYWRLDLVFDEVEVMLVKSNYDYLVTKYIINERHRFFPFPSLPPLHSRKWFDSSGRVLVSGSALPKKATNCGFLLFLACALGLFHGTKSVNWECRQLSSYGVM